jgi:chromosome transmission fidelity protein 4
MNSAVLLSWPWSTGPAAAKGKEREKKELSKQTTLFSLPSKPPAEKEKSGGLKKKVNGRPEPKEDTQSTLVDSQAIDVEMQDPVPQDATPVNGQSESDPSNALTDTQPLDADDEPIDWPDSPQAITVDDDE